MTFQEILIIIAKVSYVVLIIASVFFGMTLAVQIYVSSVIKKVLKNSRANFDKILDKKSKTECLEIIKQTEIEVVDYIETQNLIKKRKKRNKLKKAFNAKQNAEITSDLNAKTVFLDLFKGTASVFSNYGGRERGYLSFTEREIFSVIDLLRIRIENIIDSSNVIWLKTINISTFIVALNFYKSLERFKNKVWVILIVSIIDFFLWFGRVFSPHSLTRYVLKEFASDNLSVLISKAMVEVCGKELAYIYYEKSLLKDKLSKDN